MNNKPHFLTQFGNATNWEKYEVTIKAHEMYTLDFVTSKPNVFVVTNSNNEQIKVGINNIPTDDSYEFQVAPNSTETLGRPVGTTKLYLLNAGGTELKVIVFAIATDFDPEILKNVNVSVATGDLNISPEMTINDIKAGLVIPVSNSEIPELLTETNRLLTEILNKEFITIG